ncbi:MAG: hypothetical protein KA113_09060 [Syntrophaceae bacterium]|nr:hypothetical protein [Syntrophaceae bacterium]
MGNSQGWIKLHRQIMETPEWLAEPFTRGQAWVDLLLLANHETGFIRKRGLLIAVDRGQVGHSEESLAERWQWSRGKVRRFLIELARLSRISRKISKKTIQKNSSVSSLINIDNYDKYQMNDTEDGTEDGRKTVPEQRIIRMKRNIFLSDSAEIRLSELLLEKIVSRNSNFKKPNIQAWAKDIDLMIRIDKRDVSEIGQVIEWCQQDQFWQSNILSTSKLRKQYDQLIAKMQIKTVTPSRPEPADYECSHCGRRIIVKTDLTESGCVYCQRIEARA